MNKIVSCNMTDGEGGYEKKVKGNHNAEDKHGVF